MDRFSAGRPRFSQGFKAFLIYAGLGPVIGGVATLGGTLIMTAYERSAVLANWPGWVMGGAFFGLLFGALPAAVTGIFMIQGPPRHWPAPAYVASSVVSGTLFSAIFGWALTVVGFGTSDDVVFPLVFAGAGAVAGFAAGLLTFRL